MKVFFAIRVFEEIESDIKCLITEFYFVFSPIMAPNPNYLTTRLIKIESVKLIAKTVMDSK